jgi:hypothetical protein
MVTKNDVGGKGASNSASIWHCGDRGLFAIWTCRFSVNNLFPFPLATNLFIGDVMTNRWSGVKMFHSVITAPIVLAELIDFLIRRSYVNPPMFEYSSCKFYPSRLFKIWIRLRQYIGAVMVWSYWPKFPALRLFVETMPIYNVVATGNRNIEFYRETARSNCKKPAIATMPDRTWITGFFPTPLIFRYHLPLTSISRPSLLPSLLAFLLFIILL